MHLGLPRVTHENTGQTRGAGGRKSPSGVQGQSPVGRLGDEVPQKLNDIFAL